MDAAQLPGGRVNSIPEILADPQIAARGLIKTLHRDDGTAIKALGFPAVCPRRPLTIGARHRAAATTRSPCCVRC